MTDNPLGINEYMAIPDKGLAISADQIEGTSYGIGLLGSNTFRMSQTSIFSFSSNSIPAGEVGSSILTTTFARPIQKTLLDLLVTMYVNVNNDSTRIWPNGSVLTASPTTIPLLTVLADHDRGNYEGGVYKYVFTYKNQSAGAQTYYFNTRYLLPYLGIN